MTLSPAVVDEDEYALFEISGSSEYIKSTLQQLAWITATLRLQHEGQLTVSYVDFRRQKPHADELKSPDFRLRLWKQSKDPQPNSDNTGQWWTSLFTESVLAFAFPLPDNDRPEEMIGLDIPFDILASFSGVHFPVLFAGRLAFAGLTNMLIPEVFSNGSIQWHFDTIESVRQRPMSAKQTTDPRLETLDTSVLRTARAFLGYSKSSDIVLGTAECHGNSITACEVSRTGPAVTLSYEGPLGLGISAKGYASANIGTTWRFKRGESAKVTGAELRPDDLFRRAAESCTLLCDDDKCIAFLVPELSVVLQMVATYLESASLLAKKKIPRAERSSNGGKAAYEVLQSAKDVMISFKTGHQVKYEDVVKEFLLLLEQLKKQKTLRRDVSEVSLKKGLRGWDYMDAQSRKFEFWERELPTRLLKHRPIWWKLFKTSEAITLFCRMETYPILHRTNDGISSCISWSKFQRVSTYFWHIRGNSNSCSASYARKERSIRCASC